MAELYADDLQGSIENFVKDRFDSAGLEHVKIISVKVQEDRDREGSLILDITVVFEGASSELAQKEPPGFLSKLRAFAADAHHAFPVVRYQPVAA